jgi:cell division ATPase FtsA
MTVLLVARNKGSKLDVIKRYEHNKCTVDIANAMEIPESTVKIVRRHAEKIKVSCKSATRMLASKITQIRELVMKKLERNLAHWIEHQHRRAISRSTLIIQAKRLTEFFKQIDTAISIP